MSVSAMMIPSVYTKAQLAKEPVDFRIEAIVSDGMWYSLEKWKRLASVTDEQLQDWIDRGLQGGYLHQSKTGAKSYRVGYEYVKEWYKKHPVPPGKQLLSFLFPPRLWGGITEVEGFLQAPLREISIVSFICSSEVAAEVTEALRGVARVRVDRRGDYKAYGLSVPYIKAIIESVFAKHPSSETGRIYSRNKFFRREMVDFPKAYANEIVNFYMKFSESLTKSQRETIKIFLPNTEDQETQMVIWVITAIEKLDEKASVPFSGYLDSVLKRWPFDLPMDLLGKDLSSFQRERSKAIARLREKHGKDHAKSFPAAEVALEMGINTEEFSDFEESHKAWARSQNATSLTWAETSEEKPAEDLMTANSSPFDFGLAHRISKAAVEAALKTGHYGDAFAIIEQLDIHDVDMGKIEELSPEFVVALGEALTD